MNKKLSVAIASIFATALVVSVYAASNYHRPAGNILVKNISGSTYANGIPIDLGVRFIVPLADIADAATGSAMTEGQFDFLWRTNEVVSQGAYLYWDSTPGEVTTNVTGSVLLGICAEPDAKTNLSVTAQRIIVDINANGQ